MIGGVALLGGSKLCARLQAAVYVTVPELAAFRPSNRVTNFGASSSAPRPAQGPVISSTVWPNGPISAVDLLASSGSAPPPFLSSTIDRAAAHRLFARSAGLP